MQYTGYSLQQDADIGTIISGLTGATGVEGLIISNYSDFNSKNTTYTSKNTIQDGFLSNLETKATNLELGATGLAGRATTLGSDFVTIQGREDALLEGLTGTAGVTGLEARAVTFNTNILDINNKLNGEIQDTINLKVAENIFQTMKTNFETQFANYQTQLATKVETATQQVLDARQDSDDAILEKKFCSVEEFAQTFLQTYTIEKIDKSLYSFNGKIQKVDKAPPIFSIIEKGQSTTVPSAWELKIKLSDYGYNVMSGNLIVKNGSGTVVNTLSKTDFDSSTKLYTLSLAGSNSSGNLIGGPYTFEYQASTGTGVYVLTLNSTTLNSLPATVPTFITTVGTVAWGKWIGGSGSEQGRGISVGVDGVYVTGYSNGTISGITDAKPSPGTTNDGFIIKYNLDGTLAWGKWIGGSGTEQGQSVSAGSDGVYVTGYSNGTISGITDAKPGGTNDGFIVKYNLDGTLAWGKWIGGSGTEQGQSVSAGSDGVYVTGYSNGTISGITGAKPSPGSTNDGFIVKYNLDGTLAWGKWIGGSGTDVGQSVSAATDGVYVTGYSDGTITGITGTKPGDTGANNDGFIMKYNLDGTLAWGKWVGGSGNDYGQSVSVGTDGVYVSGYSNGNIEGITGTKPGGTGANNDGFIMKYNLDGTLAWGKWVGGSGYEIGMGVSAGSDGVYVTGFSNGNIEGITDTKPGGTGVNNDGFIMKYNLDGTLAWGKWIGGSGVDSLISISAGSDGVYVTGVSNGDIIGITDTKPSPTINDGFIMKFV